MASAGVNSRLRLLTPSHIVLVLDSGILHGVLWLCRTNDLPFNDASHHATRTLTA